MSMESWTEERLKAFWSKLGGEVFGSIAYAQDVWSNDPYDEESIHSEARDVFSTLLDIAADRSRGEPRGRIFVLQGDSGSGKTHLIGAFRRQVEQRKAGYFAYAQMSTELPDLRKYLLRNVVQCLQVRGGNGTDNAWLQLSDALVERPVIPSVEREALRSEEDYSGALRDIRARLLNDLSATGRAHEMHGDFLTALLALQRRDGNATNAAMKYFRGDTLSPEELDWLCSPQGLSGTGDSLQLFEWLLCAIREFSGDYGGAFVLCIDQIEDLYECNSPQQQRFPEMVGVVRSLMEHHPGVVVVLACLHDYYTAMRNHLKPTDIPRLETEPKPEYLRTERTQDEVIALVRKRLEVLDALAGIEPKAGADELFPFSRPQVEALQGLRPRAALNACYEAWLRSRSAEKLPELEIPGVASQITKPLKDPAWPQKWNDFQASWNGVLPQDPSGLAEILAWGLNELGRQSRLPIAAESPSHFVRLSIESQPFIAAVCNAPAQGGRLREQIDSLRDTAAKAGAKPIVVRSTEFAKSPRAQITQTVAQLIAAGGRRVIFPEADWRTVQAWRAFAVQHQDDDGFTRWAMNERPLIQVQGLRELVRLEELQQGTDNGETQSIGPSTNGTGSNGAEAIDLVEPPPQEPELELGPSHIVVGQTLGIRPEPVTLAVPWLTQHLAVIGGTGSGKTTLAMALVEHLLLRGVPAIVIDRKGDLARYADVDSLANVPGPLGKLFRERVKVDLFTPGNEEGRPLALPVLPARNPGAGSQEIRTQAEDAAMALSAMLGYSESRTHVARRAALIAAIQVLLEVDDAPPTMERLLTLMSSEDPALLQALGYLDRKVLRALVEGLYSFCEINARVLGAGAEPLEAERLLGLGTHATPGRTRLTVISTKFLGGDQVTQFWIAQLMMELARFASAHPSGELQGVVMLDEADLYLPAIGKPASKQPIENALRRFRSQGIGMILATQSPGDFDYRSRENIQTWLIGRVKEARALEKLRPVFSDDHTGALDKLSQHATGEFCLVRPGCLTRFQAGRNLLRTEQMSDTEIARAARVMRP